MVTFIIYLARLLDTTSEWLNPVVLLHWEATVLGLYHHSLVLILLTPGIVIAAEINDSHSNCDVTCQS